tara:strand:- start:161 stop:754 length:594 start_codon:yes stop_codon:yes gene_type:complete
VVPLVVLFFQVVGVLLAMKLDSRIVFVAQRVLVAVLSVLRLFFESLVPLARKECKLNGPPIIKEHLTNATLGAGSSSYDTAADGRQRVRMFIKGTVDATYASGALACYLVPKYHFSDSGSNVNWPNDSGGRPDYLVYPNASGLGALTISAAGDFSQAIFTSCSGQSSEYRVILDNATKNGGGTVLDVTNVYLVTELF